MILPKSENTTYEIPPEDTYLAVLYRIVDLGTQETNYKGEKKLSHKILLYWELHGGLRMEDGKPFSIAKKYTYSGHEKSTLRKDLEAWRGKKFTEEELGSFPIEKLLGVGCILGVSHREGNDGRTYADITSISKVMKGMETPPAENEVFCLEINSEKFNQENFNKLSEKLKEIIMRSPEYVKMMQYKQASHHLATPEQNLEVILDDAIPF